MSLKYIFTAILLSCFLLQTGFTLAENEGPPYEEIAAVTNVPWYWLAAADAYEHGIRAGRGEPLDDHELAIAYSAEEWSGALNPALDDTDPDRINFFQGKGKDGNDSGHADREEEFDVLFTFAEHLASYGVTDQDIQIGLWEHYNRDQAVRLISGHAALLKAYTDQDLRERAFPLPPKSHYTYHNNWGASRGWGGRRAHEGVDIFADYGTPVQATTYGRIELIGWNRFGGWRVGIRDLSNTYHYFAHLSQFTEDLEAGDLVEPGEVLGYVGSSGYGPEGTSGRFPPHLHYGMYRDNGHTEWALNPYFHLKMWDEK
ncbi:peptidase M23-like protein [Salsuginibacillus halophilus]|uniref:Peptidase M23-like protein n=1 Tax=Salsuginibacillus halophilus TaxID=517424 RepID=A0A2P8HDZ3_9BACI|nr:M23 family metallopeptidase [Salsuginibacillus halophilus]PSL44443.1 peptidase M23-like protein [Salsuginibacillus halophilus]